MKAKDFIKLLQEKAPPEAEIEFLRFENGEFIDYPMAIEGDSRWMFMGGDDCLRKMVFSIVKSTVPA